MLVLVNAITSLKTEMKLETSHICMIDISLLVLYIYTIIYMYIYIYIILYMFKSSHKNHSIYLEQH